MRVYLIGLILFGIIGCTDVTPTVSYLRPPRTPTTQSATYTQTNVIAGTTALATADGYMGQVLVHSGGELRTMLTPDNYKIEIRSLSF